MKVKDIMTASVITVGPDYTIKETMLLFSEKKISGAPVVDKNNKMVGIISETDILKVIKTRNRELKMVYPSIPIMGISFVEVEKQKEVFQALNEVSSIKISEIMSTRVLTVHASDSMEDVIPLMVKEKINRLPVVDRDGSLVGIVTRGDILKGLYEKKK
jgi:CBS domain-containing protein